MIHRGTFDAVLNEGSGRKTPSLVAFYRGVRYFGKEAKDLQTRHPSGVLHYATKFLGQSHPSDDIDKDARLFTYRYGADPESGEYRLRVAESHAALPMLRNATDEPDGAFLHPLEAAAMLLRYAHTLAVAKAESPLRDATFVLCVDPYLSQAERLHWLQAARAAGWRSTRLINSGAAFLTQWAVRQDVAEGDERTVALLDVGAMSTKVTVARVVGVNETVGKFGKKQTTQPHLHVLATAADRHVGGSHFDACLADMLRDGMGAERAAEVDASARAIARLMKEAQRAKEILSANNDYLSIIEGLLPDFDMKVPLARADFERRCGALAERVAAPLLAALAAANLTAASVGEIEGVGGGVRVPMVIDAVAAATGGRALARHLDGDEAAMMGAAMSAAMEAEVYRAAKVKLRDMLLYAVEVRVSSDEAGVARDWTTLFGNPMARIDTRRSITLTATQNLTLDVRRADTHEALAGARISGVPQRGVGRYENMTDADPKLTLVVEIDASGIVSIGRTDAEVHVVMQRKEDTLARPQKLSAAGDLVLDVWGDDAAAAERKAERQKAAEEQDEDGKEEAEAEATDGDDDDSAEKAGDEEKKAPSTVPVDAVHMVDAMSDHIATLVADKVHRDLESVGRLNQTLATFSVASMAVTDDIDDVANARRSDRCRLAALCIDAGQQQLVEATVQMCLEKLKKEKAKSKKKKTKKKEEEEEADGDETAEKKEEVVDDENDDESEPDPATQKRAIKVQLLSYRLAEQCAGAGDELSRELVTPLVYTPYEKRQVATLKSEPTDAAEQEAARDRRISYWATLKRFDEHDAMRRRIAEAKNSLESYVYRMRDALESDAVVEVTDAGERDAATAALTAARDWLDDEAGPSTTLDDVLAKRSDTEQAVSGLLLRAHSKKHVPAALKNVRSLIKSAKLFLNGVERTHVIRDKQREELESEIEKLEAWVDAGGKLEDADAADDADDNDTQGAEDGAENELTVEKVRQRAQTLLVRLRSATSAPKKVLKKPAPPKKEDSSEEGEKAEEDGEKDNSNSDDENSKDDDGDEKEDL